MVEKGEANYPEALFARLEDSLEKAIEDGVFPGVVVAATNKTGSLRYVKAFGRSACNDTGVPLSPQSVMAFASMTKLMTCIAALQLVERGTISLDDDVGPLLPDLAQSKILTGWDKEGMPLLRERQNPITLRHLLTHTAGTGYDMTNSDLARFSACQGRHINSGETVKERFGYPLTYEPGTSFEYGCGIDWVGQLVEKLSGQDLESYMQENIWGPLGIQGITFWPAAKPDIRNNQIRMAIREPNSERVTDFTGRFLTEGVTECFGGQGAYGDMESYLEILFSLLVDDEKLLSRQTTEKLFSPQLSHSSKHSLNEYIRNHPPNAFIGIFDTESEYDWGLGGILTTQDTPSGRQKGTLIWSGKPNLFWFIDRLSGLCGVFGVQVLPPGDEKIGKMIQIFENTLYSARETRRIV
ncbi:hypothetical protein AnigIFM59636_010712 [Aspergillus niger]|uniref:Beta-lactamase/transpeptidase-like protein n=1 Tax=Aspergillus phoenicis ATCC 13157 TaxID=1353007 RepID=A0A370PTS3_ASPPH|nr:beta-lactamase/transpeptidase-like protein [Aspergillus niger CBS 101883]PYH57781.1 beta-lactamase/transpeptidase-like protein [Aspergillus niger CBS 101883]RDK45589.1 beta-lactamase/transpeptidase-like protein [Aspergillus phoenicis ATCC 13157]GJP88828.1 beta-lactamase/transpeptidase-like protein [Aspergillus niger]GKZ96462.1 hypothetical protein AnigIFM59636_010712 [Aspergillus niger]